MSDYVVGQNYIIDGVLMRYAGNDTFVPIAQPEPEDLHKRFDGAGPL